MHLCTNLFCLSAATLCGHGHWLCRHMLYIFHPLKEAGPVISEEPVTLLTAHVLSHKQRNTLFKNLMKSTHHARWILPSADSCPSLPHSFPDLNCRTTTLQKQKEEHRPCTPGHVLPHLVLVWTLQTRQVALRCVPQGTSRVSSTSSTSQHKGQVFPAFRCFSLCPHTSCTGRC